MTDVLAAKRALARLANPAPLADAERAIRDLDRAARFRETGGLDRLRATAARSDGDRNARASALVRAFDRFERAAAGEPLERNHFHRGRDTPLRDGG